MKKEIDNEPRILGLRIIDFEKAFLKIFDIEVEKLKNRMLISDTLESCKNIKEH